MTRMEPHPPTLATHPEAQPHLSDARRPTDDEWLDGDDLPIGRNRVVDPSPSPELRASLCPQLPPHDPRRAHHGNRPAPAPARIALCQRPHAHPRPATPQEDASAEELRRCWRISLHAQHLAPHREQAQGHPSCPHPTLTFVSSCPADPQSGVEHHLGPPFCHVQDPAVPCHIYPRPVYR